MYIKMNKAQFLVLIYTTGTVAFVYGLMGLKAAGVLCIAFSVLYYILTKKYKIS